MMKYRKKPVVIDAYQLPAAGEDVPDSFDDWCDAVGFHEFESGRDETLIIPTLEGDHRANPGDWIIKGVAGEFYPCKPDIFARTYDLAEGGDGPAGAELIAIERRRQIEVEGYDAAHDAKHLYGTLALAGAAYAHHAGTVLSPEDEAIWLLSPPPCWPFNDEWWRPKHPLLDLVRAGALIAAEIDGLGADERKDA